MIVETTLRGGLPWLATTALMRQAKHKQVETNMSLKLFAIRLPDGSLLTDTHGQPVYYDDKKEAKRIRDRLTEHESLHSVFGGRTPYEGAITITRGPDHVRYKR